MRTFWVVERKKVHMGNDKSHHDMHVRHFDLGLTNRNDEIDMNRLALEYTT